MSSRTLQKLHPELTHAEFRRTASMDPTRLDYPEELVVLWHWGPKVGAMVRKHPERVAGVFGRLQPHELLRTIAATDLVLASELRERVEQFRAEHFKSDMVGVHVRYSDKRVPLGAICRRLESLLARRPGIGIFLATDNSEVRDLFERSYGQVLSTPHWYPAPGHSAHHNPACPDRTENARAGLLDLYLRLPATTSSRTRADVRSGGLAHLGAGARESSRRPAHRAARSAVARRRPALLLAALSPARHGEQRLQTPRGRRRQGSRAAGNRILLFATYGGGEKGFWVMTGPSPSTRCYFPSTANALLSRYPPGRRVAVASPRATPLDYTFKHPVSDLLTWLQKPDHDIGLISLRRDEYLDLNSDAFLDVVRKHRVVFVRDWYFRNAENCARHRGVICSFFTPWDEHTGRVRAVVESARKRRRASRRRPRAPRRLPAVQGRPILLTRTQPTAVSWRALRPRSLGVT